MLRYQSQIELNHCSYTYEQTGSRDTNRVPATQPLFLPTGSSSSTPAQRPPAKPVRSRNLSVPSRDPLTSTRSPTLNLHTQIASYRHMP